MKIDYKELKRILELYKFNEEEIERITGAVEESESYE